MDQIRILHESIFKFVLFYERKCGDMMFCDLNFLIKYLTLVSSVLSKGNHS